MTSVRVARTDEAKVIAAIEVETWRTTYPGILPDGVLLGMSERRLAHSWGGLLRRWPQDVMVATDDKAGVVGFGHCGPQRGVGEYAGEIFTLYVQPDAQGRGVGRQLLRALFSRLVQSGHDSALVWVIRANPSRYFYERLGGRQVAHRPIPVGGQPIDAVAYGWRDLSAELTRRARGGGRRLAGDPPHR